MLADHWIGSWGNHQWVVQVLERGTSCNGNGGRSSKGGTSTTCVCRIGALADLKLSQRDEFSWTALISQHIKCGECRQALKVYEEMRESGVKAGSHTFVAALKACSRLRDLESANQIYDDVVESGFQSDVYVATILLDVYAKCGSLEDAWLLFQKMPVRTVVVWNTMILGYAQRGEGEVSLQLYAELQQEGLVPNQRTFVGALRACSSLARSEERNKANTKQLRKQCLDQVRAIHSDILKSGCQSNVYVGNMLVDAYAKAGSLVDARHVFETMPHQDVVSWTVIILAYAKVNEGNLALQLYARMQQNRIVPDNRVFVGVLKACSSLSTLDEDTRMSGVALTKRCLEQVRAIHSDIVHAQFESNIYVGTTLVDVYAKCGSLVDARHVFEKMSYRNMVAWNAMILGYAQRKKGEVALELYRRMQQEGVVPNEQTFVAALKACSSLAAPVESAGKWKRVRKHCLEHVRAIHADVVKSGSMSAAFVGTMLVDIYARCGSLVDARFVFENMPHPDVVAWTAMILGYAQMEGQAALELYAQMQHEGVVPDAQAFVGALMACRSLATTEEETEGDGLLVRKRCLQQVKAIHRDIVKGHLESDAYVGTMLVDVYAKCGSLVDARHVFENMPDREVSCWNAMILGYAQMDEAEEALRLFARMQQEGQVPNERTFVGALQACGSMAGLEKGIEIHAEILTTGIGGTDLFVPNALIDMYGKCGSMVDAQQVFDSLPAKDIVTWGTLLAGYARQGDSELVFDFFQRMRQEGIQPNNITLIHVLTVCSHVGLVNKGQKYFQEMSKVYGITPTTEHYICMVDLLGRAGQLDKALDMVKEMPSQPDNAAWKCLLGACRKWSNTQLGREAFDCAVSLNRKDGAAYVLMCSIYAAAHMWEKVKEIEEMKLTSGAWKQPGQTWWTDIRGTTHAFAVGD